MLYDEFYPFRAWDAQHIKPIKMITTLDKVECKRGDKVWEIGLSENGYRPTMSIVHGSNNRVVNPNRCWKDYDLCLAECEKMNKERAVAG